MLQAAAFRITLIQCSIFTPHLALNPGTLAYALKRWGQKFDGPPLTMPLPDEAPTEIPSIFLRSQDNSFKMDIGRARTNVVWNRTREEGDPEVNVVVEDFREILQDFAAHVKIRPGRLALILHRVLINSWQPSRLLYNSLCLLT